MVLGGVGAIILTLGAGVFALIMHKNSQVAEASDEPTEHAVAEAPVEPEATPEEAELDIGGIISEDPLEQVVLRHFAVTNIDDVTTLKLNASLQMGANPQPENMHEVVFYFRRPNFARRVMMHGDLRFDMGFDGNEIWAQQVGSNGAVRKVDNISEKQRAQFKEAARIGSYLWKYEQAPERFSLHRDTMIDGRMCYVVEYEDEKERVLTYIDTKDYYEIAREQHPKNAEDAIAFMRMTEHTEKNGVVMPMKIETSSNGEVFSKVAIDHMEINAGVPSYIFNEPSVRYSAK